MHGLSSNHKKVNSKSCYFCVRYINNLLPDEAELTKELAYDIVRRQQEHMVISSWALMAAVLMQSRDGISLQQLVKEVEWLKRLGLNLGAYIDWPGKMITVYAIIYCQYHLIKEVKWTQWGLAYADLVKYIIKEPSAIIRTSTCTCTCTCMYF